MSIAILHEESIDLDIFDISAMEERDFINYMMRTRVRIKIKLKIYKLKCDSKIIKKDKNNTVSSL